MEPYPSGALLINTVTSVAASPAYLIATADLIMEMITLFGNDSEIYGLDRVGPYASSFVKCNLPGLASLVLYGGPNSLQYYYSLIFQALSYDQQRIS